MKHLFAIYLYPGSFSLEENQKVARLFIKDKELLSRLSNILRIKPNTLIEFFTEELIYPVNTKEITRKLYTGEVLKTRELPAYKNITCGLPILKKENFEQALYSLSQLGVQKIIPLITEKSQQKITGDREKLKARYKKILIAAAEQAKSYIIPDILNPESLESFCSRKKNSDALLSFEAGKQELIKLPESLKNLSGNLYITLGPEGGFTENELKFLEKSGGQLFNLTPTILRSIEAITLGIGFVRSFWK